VEVLHYLGAWLAGMLIGIASGVFPALHVYNIFGFVVLVILKFSLSWKLILTFAVALITAYCFSNTISSVFFSLPDESTAFMVLPAAKMLARGRGYEAVVMTNIGALLGLAFFAVVIYLATPQLYLLHGVLRDLTPEILLVILVYLVVQEWPKFFEGRKTGFALFLEGMKSILAGIFVWIASGLLGFYILNKTLVPSEWAFQGLMPAFVGFFAVPWLIFNIVAPHLKSEQYVPDDVEVDGETMGASVVAGTLAGSLAAYLPIITGGMAGVLAGHTLASRSSRVFMVSYGASKTIYYVGALIVSLVPTIYLTRGGLAWMLAPFKVEYSPSDFGFALGLMLLTAGFSFLIVDYLARLIARIYHRLNISLISVILLVLITGVVYFIASVQGLVIMIAATGIGIFAVVFNTRRLNCMGVLLIPVVFNMFGWTDYLREWLF